MPILTQNDDFSQDINTISITTPMFSDTVPVFSNAVIIGSEISEEYNPGDMDYDHGGIDSELGSDQGNNKPQELLEAPDSPQGGKDALQATFDPRTAEIFIEALTGSSETKIRWQTFDDKAKKSPKLVKQWDGSIQEGLADLERLNKSGAGIFFAVNETDGLGRKKENIVTPRALYLDFDSKNNQFIDEAKMALLPEPSAIIRSGGGQHVYWLLKPQEPLEALEPALVRLSSYMGSDPAVKIRNQVMRLPGSIHNKQESFVVQMETCNPENRYTIAEIMANVPSLDANKTSEATPEAPKDPKVTPEAKQTVKQKAKPTLQTSEQITADNYLEKLTKIKTHLKFDWAVEAVRKCTQNRNQLLNLVAFGMYYLVPLSVPQSWLTERLVDAAVASGLSSEEALTTIDSAFTAAHKKGVGKTENQTIWHNFERIYGKTAIYNERNLTTSIAGKHPKMEVERVHFINDTCEDITPKKFGEELNSWVMTYNSYDPYKEYLDSLPTLPTKDAWAAFDDLAKEMGLSNPLDARLLARHRIGVVTRTYEPGASMQWALGLVGDAGCGKSTYFESYSAESTHCKKVGAGLVSDKSIDKDAWLDLFQAVVVDIDEIDTVMSSSSWGRLKSVLSRTESAVRPPYATAVVNNKFRFVWGFTSNSITPLQDDGANNRRYATIKMEGTMSDGKRRHAYYNKHRDLLNAAAKSLFLAGESCSLPDLELAQQAIQTESYVSRSLAYSIALTALSEIGLELAVATGKGKKVRGFHIEQIYMIFTPEGKSLYPSDKIDIQKALKEKSWVSIRIQNEGARHTLWVPSSIDKESLVGIQTQEAMATIKQRYNPSAR